MNSSNIHNSPEALALQSLIEQAYELKKTGQEQQALAAAVQALKLDPRLADMWDFVGVLLLERGRWHEAMNYLKQAIELVPENAVFRSHYAMALMEDGNLLEAQSHLQIALKDQPTCADAQFMMGEVLCRAGYYDLAIPFYDKAQQEPGLKRSATFGKAFATFIGGSFDEGMALFTAADPALDAMPLPDWQGEVNPDLHLVLMGEYGYGDILQFIRYANLARTRVGKVTLSVPYALLDLVRHNFPHESLHTFHVPPEHARSLPAHVTTLIPPSATARCFYMNLPHLLCEPFDALSSEVPYIHSTQEQQAYWQEKLANIPRPWIGLVWSGNPRNQNNHNRSLPFATLQPLIATAQSHIISMQYDDPEHFAAQAGLFDASSQIKDFSDSAGLISVLDLVISPCSAPAHLAGAMGKPVWIPLAFNADWRWLIDRQDSIWYPTAQLFRQPAPKDWHSVVALMTEKLGSLMTGDRKVLNPPPWNGTHLSRHPHALPGK